jgi:BlaI family transcriptional regulator, penicillinase repressor
MANPNISDAEWQVMKCLWDGGPATAGELVDRVQTQGHRWHSRTVKTMLGRLVKKGAVESTADEKRFVYRAKVSRQECIKRESKSFLARVFDGAAAPALVHFLEHTNLPADEIDRLRALLEKQKNKGAKP